MRILLSVFALCFAVSVEAQEIKQIQAIDGLLNARIVGDSVLVDVESKPKIIFAATVTVNDDESLLVFRGQEIIIPDAKDNVYLVKGAGDYKVVLFKNAKPVKVFPLTVGVPTPEPEPGPEPEGITAKVQAAVDKMINNSKRGDYAGFLYALAKTLEQSPQVTLADAVQQIDRYQKTLPAEWITVNRLIFEDSKNLRLSRQEFIEYYRQVAKGVCPLCLP
jgi:hypothetical protein